MKYTAAAIPDQSGKVAVVTGANGGLGLETARVLASKGAHVVMAVRNRAKAEDAQAAIAAEDPAGTTELVDLDLGSQASAHNAAADIAARYDRIDLLVNNAGVMAPPAGATADGFETQIGVNHLGHWTFTAGLLDSLQRSPAARVVSVTSFARHYRSGLSADSLGLGEKYDGWRTYGRSKRANYLFAIGLNQRLQGTTVQSLAAHPGLSHSDLQQTTVDMGAGGFIGWASNLLAEHAGMEVADGAMPQLRAATDPAARGGQLYGPRFVTFGPAVNLPVRSAPRAAIDRLWRISQEATGVNLP